MAILALLLCIKEAAADKSIAEERDEGLHC